MAVPFLDLGAAYAELREGLDSACSRVLASGRFVQGLEVSAFESEFAAYCDVDHCVGVANGLDALHLILRAYAIGAGDEVIVPSNTFIATWLAVTHAGAIPVPVEPRADTFNLDPSLVEASITPRTRAIIAVHLYGQCADMTALAEICTRRGLLLFEDAAQSHGARWRGVRAGGLGDAAAFSFYPGKNLGAFGDAGAVVTDDPDVAHRVRLLGNYGSAVKYEHGMVGFNSRLDELQAALLRVKLRVLDEWNARRRRVAGTYLRELADTGLVLPCEHPDSEAVWHLFVVRTKRRAEFQQFLESHGIHTLIHYPIAPHLQNAYSTLGHAAGDFPISEAMHDEVLSLPMSPHLDRDQTDAVIAACRAAKQGGLLDRAQVHG